MTSETYAPRIGGAEIHVEKIIQELVNNGHQVTLVTNELGEGGLIPGVSIVRIGWRPRNTFAILRALWISSREAEIIHSHYCHRLAMFAGVIARLRGVRQVITLHGMGILDPATKKFRARKLHAFYRRTSLFLCSHVISTSQDLAEVAYKFISQSKVTVIYNGFDPLIFNPEKFPSVTENPLGILTVRRLVPKNGIQYIVEAMPEILKVLPLARLTIVGDGPLRSHLETRVEDLAIGYAVTFVGFKQGDELVNYLAQAGVVVFPSTAESVSLACVEAMGMRKKVVVSKVGGLIELVGENEERGWFTQIVDWQGSNYDAPLTAPTERISNLAAAVVSAIEDPDANRRIDAAYKYVVEKLTWKTIVSLTECVYLKD